MIETAAGSGATATVDALPLSATDQRVADLLVSTGRLDASAIEAASQESFARPSLSLVDALVVLKLLPLREAQVFLDRAQGKPVGGPIGAPPGLTGRGTDWPAAAAGFRTLWQSVVVMWLAMGLAGVGLLVAYSSATSALEGMATGSTPISLAALQSALSAGVTAFLLGALVLAVSYMMLVAGLGTVATSAPSVGGLRAMASISALFLSPAMILTSVGILTFSIFGLAGATAGAVRNYLSLDLGTFQTLATILMVVWGLASVSALVGGGFFVALLQRIGNVFGSLRLGRLTWFALGTMIVGVLIFPLAAFLKLGNGFTLAALIASPVFSLTSSILWYSAFRECHELVRPA